ncbi:MAG: DUF4394 domain-containing protein, partial [Acidobacteriota bacterium]|nr:DUF4394 domain-containing protein [Acidobacteriota bacterium]
GGMQASNLTITLENGAEAYNVFFVTKGAATIGTGIEFKGTIVAQDEVSIGGGSRVIGRVLSLTEAVKLTEAAVDGAGTGILEICKAATEPGLNLVGLTTANQLVLFNTGSANSAVTTPVTITGLPGGVTILGIDFRPTTASASINTGQLFGLGSNSSLYTINPFTGVATLVGPLGVALSGTNFGFDFNPTIDRIRVVSDTGQNLSVNPNDGVATVQTPLNPGAPSVTASGYTNNFAGATTTSLNEIDTNTDTLNTQNPAPSGTLTLVGPLGVNASGVNGFDISPVNNTALAALQVGGSTTSGLYQINLATGAATFISTINTAAGLRGLAIAPGGSTGLGNPNGLANRIFSFRIGGIVREAPVGGCTGPIDLPAGPVVVEELLEGRLTTGGTFSGRFRLVGVTSSVAGSLGTVNLPLRTAVVTVREGSISNQTVVTFINTFAVNAVIEICKFPAAGSPDVTGFFNFTIDALLNTIITVPVGGCSGPIQVNVPTTPSGVPATADVLVTEIGRDGFTLESASTFPADRFNFLNLGIGIVNNNNNCIGFNFEPNVPIPGPCVVSNPGGGVVSADVVEGGTSNQTTVSFFNRANPARLKVCKIAGPGIPEGTPFTFEVRGTVASSPTVIQPGVQVSRFITVPAGPAAQGGFCDFVRDTNGEFTRFIVGTNIAINETGFTIPIPGVGPGQVRTGNIRSSTGFTATPVSVTGGPGTISSVVPT